jgi:hypothetical protein
VLPYRQPRWPSEAILVGLRTNFAQVLSGISPLRKGVPVPTSEAPACFSLYGRSENPISTKLNFALTEFSEVRMAPVRCGTPS